MDMLIIIIVTLVAGFLGGLLGVGGGILMVPAFVFLLKNHVPTMHVAVGTSLALIVINALAGSVQHALARHINWQVVACGAAFAVAGGSLGAYASKFVGNAALQRLFAVLLLAVALRMFFAPPRAAAPSGGESKAPTVHFGADPTSAAGLETKTTDGAPAEEKK
ncbi:MAG: sulfite exporter TauE/SafE family protein [Candidatus Sumerlaeia bacterium]|nr:sulfite exporter TauE/SafE family protein [Candidatus Sumerlaeia bacterium]